MLTLRAIIQRTAGGGGMVRACRGAALRTFLSPTTARRCNAASSTAAESSTAASILGSLAWSCCTHTRSSGRPSPSGAAWRAARCTSLPARSAWTAKTHKWREDRVSAPALPCSQLLLLRPRARIQRQAGLRAIGAEDFYTGIHGNGHANDVSVWYTGMYGVPVTCAGQQRATRRLL